MRETRSWLACAALCATAMLACGGETETIGGPGPAPTNPPVGQGTPGGPGPAADPLPPAPSREGHVVVTTMESTYEPGKSGFGVSSYAWFGVDEGPAGEAISDCKLVEEAFPPTSTNADPPSDNAGSVEVGVTLGTEVNNLKLPFDATKLEYESFSGTAGGVANGTIHIRARGGAVPAFNVDFIPQVPVKVVSPVVKSKVGPRDLPISWTSDPGAEFAMIFVAAGVKEVQCAVTKGKPSEITIPAALMTGLLEGAKEDVRLMVYVGKSTKIDVGDYRIRIAHNSIVNVDLLKE